MTTPNAAARAFRRFCLARNFKGKTRIERALTSLVRLPSQVSHPDGFTMTIDPRSSFERSFYFHDCEPDVAAILRAELEPESVFWDVGANMGFYSCLAASLVGPDGQVLALEPTPRIYERLRIHAEQWPNVTAINTAVGDTEGTAVIYSLDSDNHGMNTLAQSSGGQPVGECATATLDSIGESRRPPDWVKIDVEGAELAVLLGAQRTLSHHPSLIVELGQQTQSRFGVTPADVVDVLTEAGYRGAWVRGGVAITDPACLPHQEAFGAEIGGNYIFRHG